MRNLFPILFIAIISFCYCSCTIQYNLTVKNDESAVVQTDVDWNSPHMKKLNSSSCIAVLDSSGEGLNVTFTVSSIDSIGKYLPNAPVDFFQFRMRNDTLVISENVDNWSDTIHWSTKIYSFQIQTEKAIVNIEKVSGTTKKIDNHTLSISRSRKQIARRKKPMIVKVILSNG